MANLKDLIKSALDKKNQGTGSTGVKNASDSGKKAAKDQVMNHKPAKKSAGRGR